MAVLLHIFTYVALVIAVVAIVVKAYKYASMPIHLRWELYPVPKEGDKVAHGGSFYEDLDWWTKKRPNSLVSEVMAMVPEMLFIKVLYENNRKLWYRSFPFHFGLYILIGTMGLVVFQGLLGVTGLKFPLPILQLLTGFTALLGTLGLILATIGAAALLHRRLTDEDLIDFTAPRDIFNLVAFLAALVSAWIGIVFSQNGMMNLQMYVYNLLTFNLTAEVGGIWFGISMLLFSFLILYVPLTHMSHFITKFFMWDKVRWDDEPNMRGSVIEQKIMTNVGYPVSWAGKHLNADGKKNWVDIATEDMAQK